MDISREEFQLLLHSSCKRMALQLAAKSQAQGATPLIYSWKYHVFWSFQVILKIYKHIDFSTSLIKKEHKNISGLQSGLTLAFIKKPMYSDVAPALHIFHCRGNHWIVITNIGCTLGKVKVFDSIYFTVYQETLKQIYSIYGANVQVSVENGPN